MSAAAPAKSKPRDLLKAARLHEQLGLVLRFAQAAVWEDLVAALEPFGLRPAHYATLAIAKAVPGCRQQEIGEALGIRRTNLVALIDDLQEAGLLLRRNHPEDRRSHALYLSAEGVRRLDAMERAHAKHVRRIEETLSPAERTCLMTALRKLARLKYADLS